MCGTGRQAETAAGSDDGAVADKTDGETAVSYTHLCIRGTLQCFDIPFIMTNGGPGYASSTFTLYTIDTAFKYNSFGMAATMAVAIMAIVILVYVFQNVVLKKVFNQEEAA